MHQWRRKSVTVKAFMQKAHIATLVSVIANQIHPSPFNCHAEMQLQRLKCITPQTRSLKTLLHNIVTRVRHITRHWKKPQSFNCEETMWEDTNQMSVRTFGAALLSLCYTFTTWITHTACRWQVHQLSWCHNFTSGSGKKARVEEEQTQY